MSPCRISLRIVGISIVAMFSACAPDLSVAPPATSSSSSGGTGGDGGASTSSSSSSSASSTGGPLGANGTACQTEGECESGFCEDNVCCGEACGECRRCDTDSSKGTCTSIGVGKDDCSTPGELCNGVSQCACGVSAPFDGGSCPSPWVAGLLPGACRYKCDTQDACKDMILTCPAGFDCFVECSGTASCTGAAVIQCPEKHMCVVYCTGPDACKGPAVQVQCSADGPCTLECMNTQPGTCDGSPKLICGDNACAAICSGANKPTIVPNNSCNATGC